jgi:ubiquinone/menaquinone biosynthesis C-methylase UbiE
MIKECYHLLRHAPGTLYRQSTQSPVEFFKDFTEKMDADGFGALRANLVADLDGHILEIGAGTGAAFPHYADDVRVTAIEPSYTYREAAREVAREVPTDITVISAVGEFLPFPDDIFDAISVSMVLCSVASPSETLAEFKRVLRPGGRVHLLEHVRSEDWLAGPLMDLTNPLWLFANRIGCNLNRKTVECVEEAGFTIQSIESAKIYTRASPVTFPFRVIKAELPS